MRIIGLVFCAALWLDAPSAHACDPQDALVQLTAVGDDFVFITNETLVRVTAPNTVRHRRDIGGSSGAVLAPDGRTLYRAVGQGYSGGCVPEFLVFERLDTIREGRPQRLGRMPRRTEEGAWLSSLSVRDGSVRAEVTSMSDGGNINTVYWATLPARGQLRQQEGERRDLSEPDDEPETPRPAYDPERPVPLATFGPLSARFHRVQREVRVLSGQRILVRATVPTDRDALSGAFASDGRYLGIATFEIVNEDYGTGFEARLDVIDLTTGEVHTPHGESTGLSNVRGRARLRCEQRVNDPGSALNVRAQPRGRARVVGTVVHDSVVTVVESRGSWRRISAPHEGWVFANNLRERCRLQN